MLAQTDTSYQCEGEMQASDTQLCPFSHTAARREQMEAVMLTLYAAINC